MYMTIISLIYKQEWQATTEKRILEEQKQELLQNIYPVALDNDTEDDTTVTSIEFDNDYLEVLVLGGF